MRIIWGEGCSRKWDNHCTLPRLNGWLFTGICKLSRNDHLAAVGVVNPGEDSFTVQCNLKSSKSMQFRGSSSMHSGEKQEICIILTQMMILFIEELNRSGQRFQPEKISEWENRADGRRWIDQSAFLRTCGTVYLWNMKIWVHFFDLIETADQLPELMQSWWILKKINLHA